MRGRPGFPSSACSLQTPCARTIMRERPSTICSLSCLLSPYHALCKMPVWHIWSFPPAAHADCRRTAMIGRPPPACANIAHLAWCACTCSMHTTHGYQANLTNDLAISCLGHMLSCCMRLPSGLILGSVNLDVLPALSSRNIVPYGCD